MCSLWDPSFPARIEPTSLALKGQSPNHWAARKSLALPDFLNIIALYIPVENLRNGKKEMYFSYELEHISFYIFPYILYIYIYMYCIYYIYCSV